MAESLPPNATVSQRLADWVGRIELADIPAPVVTKAKWHLLDALGSAIASSGMDFGQAVHAAGRTLGSGTDSATIRFGTRLPAASAALVNGTLIHGLDFDDTHIEAIHHASAPALAAALAAGDAVDADGERVLLGYIVGLELGCRLSVAAHGAFHDHSFHPTGVIGTFAAACVAGRIRNAPAEALVNALGLCGSQAAGILELKESWLKRFHPGWAAHSGLIAVALGEAGFRGPATVFEGDKGLYASHLGTVPEIELDDLGSRWMTADIALKPYPCCHFVHAFIDAAMDLHREYGFRPEDIVAIEAPTSERLLPAVAEPHARRAAPPTIYDALFSTQYAVALAIVTQRVDLASFYDDRLDDPAVLAVADKVHCTIDPLSDYPRHFPGELAIELTDGRVLRRRITASRGTAEHPLSDADIRAKFLTNAEREISAEDANAIVDLVTRFEQLPDVEAVLAHTVT